MTDAQLIAIAITVLAVLAGTLFSNARISDLNSSLNNRIGDVKEVLRAELGQDRAESNSRLDRLDQKLDRISETLSAVIGDHEQRIRAIEQQRHIS